MKIIIEKDGIKREIHGPFNICGSSEDLKRVAACIDRQADFAFGWVNIVESEPTKPNSHPIPWDK